MSETAGADWHLSDTQTNSPAQEQDKLKRESVKRNQAELDRFTCDLGKIIIHYCVTIINSYFPFFLTVVDWHAAHESAKHHREAETCNLGKLQEVDKDGEACFTEYAKQDIWHCTSKMAFRYEDLDHQNHLHPRNAWEQIT